MNTKYGSVENSRIIPLPLHVVFFSSPAKADCYASSGRLGPSNEGVSGSVVSTYETENLPIASASSAAPTNNSEALMMGKLCSRHLSKDCPQIHLECRHCRDPRKSVQGFVSLV